VKYCERLVLSRCRYRIYVCYKDVAKHFHVCKSYAKLLYLNCPAITKGFQLWHYGIFSEKINTVTKLYKASSAKIFGKSSSQISHKARWKLAEKGSSTDIFSKFLHHRTGRSATCITCKEAAWVPVLDITRKKNVPTSVG
jgi:hypothetical protein